MLADNFLLRSGVEAAVIWKAPSGELGNQRAELVGPEKEESAVAKSPGAAPTPVPGPEHTSPEKAPWTNPRGG